MLVLVRRELDDPVGAEAAIRPLLGQPRAPIQHLAGLTARDLGNGRVAVLRFRRALLLDPAHAGAWKGLLALRPRASSAIAWATAAAVVEPGDPDVWSDLAFAVLVSGRADVPPRIGRLLAHAADRDVVAGFAGWLRVFLPERAESPEAREWVRARQAELADLLERVLWWFGSEPDVVSALELRVRRIAVRWPDLLGSWLGLLVTAGEGVRPGDTRPARAAARVVAFGGLHADTGALRRPFDACVAAKANAKPGDGNTALRVGHALGLKALSDTVARPISLRSTDKCRHVEIGDRRIRYAAPSETIAGFTTLIFAFEPGLWRWMAGFRPDDVLLDIGANVGIYTIAAAGLFGVRVVALEPYGPNLEVLRRNVAINRLSDRVAVLPIAATDVERRGRLFHEGGAAGAASQHFEGVNGEVGQATFEEVAGVPVDVLVERGTIPFPTRIKIDVDGNERAVIEGMTRTLADPRLHSVRLEVRWGRPEGRAVVERVESFGFRAAIDDDAKNLLFTRTNFPSPIR
ncbi:FkbM family methyltransferase [Thalassobaculum sp.]|uniref:FkbM family methyltransferase n=1 Tax=Thalassobaculum sp. TaxID=2022740 RepID=UPI0032EAD31C